jgi:glycine/D-amino acid oxidase-like deaminating enzyme
MPEWRRPWRRQSLGRRIWDEDNVTETFDVVVVGAGVVGASAAFHLAKLGGARVCVVDRGPVCGGGTAKSCAIVRSHYSIATNTQFTLASLEMFASFQEYLGDGEVDSGFVNSGYLIVAGEGEVAGRLKANLDMQAGVGAETFEIDKAEAKRLHPDIKLDDVALIGYEPKSGYADPYLTTSGFITAARRLGVELRTECEALEVLTEAGRVTGLRTSQGDIQAGQVLLAVGPWTRGLAEGLIPDLPLEVSRHVVLTFRGAAPYEKATPIVKDLTTANKMYFRPASGGVVLVGTGDHGDPVASPDHMDENTPEDLVLLQGGQLARRVDGFAEAELTASWIGPYDITPDWNPVLGPVEAVPGLSIAYGFSGHGFKLAPAVGKALAQSMLGQATVVPLEGYRLGRFAEDELLRGAYGIGSIS